MTELQKTFDEGDPKGLLQLELDDDLHSTAEVLPPPTASAPLAVKDASEDGIGSLPVESSRQESFERKKVLGKKFGYIPAVLMVIIGIFTLILARRQITADMEKRVLPYPVPTDDEGLHETLKDVQMSARRLRTKLYQAPESAVLLFMESFSPAASFREYTEVDFRSWCEGYADYLYSQPIPDERASKVERQDFALQNLLLATFFRAAERRVDLATTLAELSVRNEIPALFMHPHLLPHQVAQRCSEGDVSFQNFTRRLETLGAVGVAEQGDSGPTVPLKIAYDLADAAAFKIRYEESNQDVYRLFEKFLASAEEAMIGRSDAEKSRVNNIHLPGHEIPFPLVVFAEALERSKLAAEAGRLPLSEILNLRTRWNAGTVSSAAMDAKFLHEGIGDNGLDVKFSALKFWGFWENKETVIGHLFVVALFLL